MLDVDEEEPSAARSASVPDADVVADSEDIDAPTSVLAHVELSRTSRESFFARSEVLANYILNRREKAGTKCSCASQRASHPTLG